MYDTVQRDSAKTLRKAASLEMRIHPHMLNKIADDLETLTEVVKRASKMDAANGLQVAAIRMEACKALNTTLASRVADFTP